MSCVALEPFVERRHGVHRVFVEQGHERVHVVALEGVDVAGQQRLLRFVDRFDRMARDIATLESGARSLQRAVGRRNRCVEQFRGLDRAQSQDVPQNEHRSLPRRQMLQRGDERQPDALARHRHLRGVAARREHPTVRDRLDPRLGAEWLAQAEHPQWSRDPDRSDAARRCLPFNRSKQTFVAIRYNHERTDERPSKRSNARHARTMVSCTASSASKAEPSMR